MQFKKGVQLSQLHQPIGIQLFCVLRELFGAVETTAPPESTHLRLIRPSAS